MPRGGFHANPPSIHDHAERTSRRADEISRVGDGIGSAGLPDRTLGLIGQPSTAGQRRFVIRSRSVVSGAGSRLRDQSDRLHASASRISDTDAAHADRLRRIEPSAGSSRARPRSATTTSGFGPVRTQSARSGQRSGEGGLRRQWGISSLRPVPPSRPTGRHNQPDLTSSTTQSGLRWDHQTPANFDGRARPARTGPHHATASVYNSSGGRVGQPTHWVSGNMTDDERRLNDGYGRSLATHTEQRVVRHYQGGLGPGDRLVVQGHYSPCPSCQTGLRHVHAQTGADVEYQWRDEITGLERTWRPEFSSQQQMNTYYRRRPSGF